MKGGSRKRQVDVVPGVIGHRNLITNTANANGAIALGIVTRAFDSVNVPMFVTSIGNSVTKVVGPKASDRSVRGHVKGFGLASTKFTCGKCPIAL